MNHLAWVGMALGGAAGSVLRYAFQSAFRFPGFPFATLGINLAGSFLIGICAALAERGFPGLRGWLMAGFLGGFTTFSAFSLENVQLLREGRALTALGYIFLSVAGGIFLAFAGYAAARMPGS